MSEVNIPAMAQAGESKIENAMLTPMQELNEALKHCKFGKFHIKLLASAMFGIVCNVLVSMNTSYILPIAECDLEMDLTMKGGLNAIPYFGMLFSSIIAGFLTDTFGRKIFLQCGYGGIFVCTLVAGTSQTYRVLVTAKFFEGVLFAASFNAMIAYTSEFCHNGIRDRVMLVQSSCLAVAHITISGFSWAILTQEWHVSLWNGLLELNTWNFYLYICSLWSCAAFILYTLLPESPKYYISQGKYEQARAIIIDIYVENTGKPPETSQAWVLWRNSSKVDLSACNQPLRKKMLSGLENLKMMFRKPLLLYLVLICSMTFFNMMVYNVLRLWFPQLSTIIEHYKGDGNQQQEFCYILDVYTADVQNKVNNDTTCVPQKSGHETYINNMVLGLVCFVPYFLSGVLVNRLGKKVLVVIAGCAVSCATFFLPWASTKPAVVSLFSMDVALTQTIMSLFQTFIVEFFPTTVRSLAIGMTMTSGRLGTLVGNILFPIVLAYGCNILFYAMTGFIIGVTSMCFLLPNKKK